MKTCFKCGQAKPKEDFYRHAAMGDGYLGKCKECAKADERNRRRTNPEKLSEYERARFADPERKRQMAQCAKRRDPAKTKANRAASNAIRGGRLVRQPCERCGSLTVEAHHEDYSKPLEVRWLCFKHHREAHGQTVVVEVPRNRKPNVILEAAHG